MDCQAGAGDRYCDSDLCSSFNRGDRALLLTRAPNPALAYIAGSLGTLIGGDLMNLKNLQSLGAPIVSIGGAGTFDGVFLTGIIAVLLA